MTDKRFNLLIMRPLFIALLFCLLVESGAKANDELSCVISDQLISIKNTGTTIRIDNELHFEISFEDKGINCQITDLNKSTPSIFLNDSLNNRISFRRISAEQMDINDRFGKGKRMNIKAISQDGTILCTASISSFISFPNVFLVQSSFQNISAKDYYIRNYTINHLSLGSPPGKGVWWSFQGASYHWGLDFIFKLPESFDRENFMGLNDITYGGGIPLVDVWTKKFGLALAFVGEKPTPVSLPVLANGGSVQLEIKDKPNQLLKPGGSLVAVHSAIIVHRNDFFDPLRTYSGLMRTGLPGFLKPGYLEYEPEWCTWGYHQNFKPADILDKLGQLKSLGIKSVIFDDGWSLNHGDWIPDPQKFPAGDKDFKRLIDSIHQAGLKTWIWWVPGYVDSTSMVAIQHPDWMIKNQDGTIHRSFGLCPAYPPVQEHYKKLVRKFVEEYKVDGFKMDFSVINAAASCYNPVHHHSSSLDSYQDTPLLFKNIYETASQYNPDILLEYCACSIPPSIYNLPFTNLAVTSDPNISQITERIKMYKALRGDDFPVLEEYCGVLCGPVYQLAIGAGGVPGTFSTNLDNYHEKWLAIYHKYQLSKGQYLNLYDLGFDYPEAHVIKKDNKFYYAFYTHGWDQLAAPLRQHFRFGSEFDFNLHRKTELVYPKENFTGKIDLRGLDEKIKYRAINYVDNKELGIIDGLKPYLKVSFDDYLFLELIPLK